MSLRVGNYKATSTKIPVTHLCNVVQLDTEKMTVFVEPMVTMGQITHTLNHLGLTLPVLPELDDLTVGGLCCGVGVETSSHKYGLFTHTCVTFEIVTAEGEVKRCSATENPELFRAIPWSHGTLGFLVGVEIKVIQAKPWVRVEYEPIRDKEAAVQACKEAFDDTSIDFVEALVYSTDDWVIMKGYMVESPEPGLVNAIGNYWKPWFFTHVQKYLDSGAGVEYIPLRDYYHRHTRSLFWEIQDIVTFGNHPIFRYLLGWAMPPNISIMKRLQTEELRKLYELHHVVQDMLIPVSTLSEGMSVMDKEFDVYPIWICPMRIFQEDSGFLHPTKSGEEMFVDVGVYGVPGTPARSLAARTRTDASGGFGSSFLLALLHMHVHVHTHTRRDGQRLLTIWLFIITVRVRVRIYNRLRFWAPWPDRFCSFTQLPPLRRFRP